MKNKKQTNWTSRLIWGGGGMAFGYITGRLHQSFRDKALIKETSDSDKKEQTRYPSNAISPLTASNQTLKLIFGFLVQYITYLNKNPSISNTAMMQISNKDRQKITAIIQRVKNLGLSEYSFLPDLFEQDSSSSDLHKLQELAVCLPPSSNRDDLEELSSAVNGVRIDYDLLAGELAVIIAEVLIVDDISKRIEASRLIVDFLIVAKPFFWHSSEIIILEWADQVSEVHIQWIQVMRIFANARGPRAVWCTKCGYYDLEEDASLIEPAPRHKCPKCGDIKIGTSICSNSLQGHRDMLKACRQGIIGCLCGYIPSLIPISKGEKFEFKNCEVCGHTMKILRHEDI